MTSIGRFSAGFHAATLSGDRFTGMRAQLDDLSRQLSTGRRGESYADLGVRRGTSLDTRARLSLLDGYKTAIGDASFRVKLMMESVEAIDAGARTVNGQALTGSFSLGPDGRTIAQNGAEQSLRLALDALNQEADGRYLFGGRRTDQAPVESFERIMNGDAGHIGLRQYANERITADLGIGDARLPITAGASNQVVMTRSHPGVYGLQIGGVGSIGTGVAASTSAGPPASATVAFTLPTSTNPTVTVELGLPDGTTTVLSFRGRTTAPIGAGEFLVDPANADNTASSFRAQLTAARDALQPELRAASTVAAGKAFFAGSTTSPPPSIYSALPVLGWYRGDDDPAITARGTAPVQVDSGQTVGTGARANEGAFAGALAGLAALSLPTYADTPTDRARYQAMTERASAALRPPASGQTVARVAEELGHAQSAMAGAKERHEAVGALLQEALDGIENAPPEEVAAQLLSLQTRLQASYQVTARLSQLSLVNYL